MFIDDDFDPKTKKLKPRVLDLLSVDELKIYIEDLKNEITRAEADIAKKEKSKAAADSLFKK
jgi:uncharacterized small protein (DUF1192 family)